MAGKMTTSTATNSKEDPRVVKAYAEGAAVGAPTNPHPADTPENVAYAAGLADRITAVAAISSCVAGGQLQNYWPSTHTTT